MKMAARKQLPKEVQAMFDKYTVNNVRNLKKHAALSLFKEEFGLTDDQAETMFYTFDKDKNEIMSVWEFQQFYVCLGNAGAQQMVETFEKLDKDGSGKLDKQEATEGLKSMGLAEREVEFFIKSSTGDDDFIDIGEFCGLLYKLKMFEAKKKKK